MIRLALQQFSIIVSLKKNTRETEVFKLVKRDVENVKIIIKNVTTRLQYSKETHRGRDLY